MTTKFNKFDNIDELRDNEVFKVPEGYFDSLTSRIMDQIPADEVENDNESKVVEMKTGRNRRYFIWSSVAACFIAIIGAISIYTTTNKHEDNVAMETDIFDLAEDDYQKAIEYSLVDNQDIYCYLSGNEY